ncbi:MAG: hypothetical protein RR654_03360, partial [Oscillospiraceae bacterium]
MSPTPRANGTWAGDGTEAKPYLIADAADLTKLATVVNGGTNYSGKFFKLTANIDLSGQSWVPIGNGRAFNGTFDGGGHEVTLNITASIADAGLFGYVDQDGVVQNVGVSGTVSGTDNAGGIAAINHGTVQSCYNTANISCSFDDSNLSTGTGGIVGWNYPGELIGGLNRKSTIKNCYNTGSVSGNYRVGGITGDNGTVESCYNT